jgi:YVTN family beta-propeller protein
MVSQDSAIHPLGFECTNAARPCAVPSMLAALEVTIAAAFVLALSTGAPPATSVGRVGVGRNLLRRLVKMKVSTMLRPFMIGLVLLGLVTSSFGQKSIVTIPVGDFPGGVAVNRLTNRIYVANEFGRFIPPSLEEPNTVSVIDGSHNRVIDEIVTGLDFQIGIAVDEVRNIIYIATLDNGVDVLDGKTDKVITNIPVAGEPVYPGINTFTKSVYVSDQLSSSVTVLGEDENDIVATIPLGGGPNISEPEGVAVDPLTNRIYVTNFESAGSVWMIDGRTNTLAATIPVGSSPFGIAVNPLTRSVYVANSCEAEQRPGFSSCQNVSVINEETNEVTVNVPVTGNPVHVAVDELRNRLYSCNIMKNGSFNLSIIDGKHNRALATVPLVGAYCGGLTMNTFTNLIYFTDDNTNSVTVIRGMPGRILAGER